MISLGLRYKGWPVKKLAYRLQCDDMDITALTSLVRPFTQEWAERIGGELELPVGFFLLDVPSIPAGHLPDVELAAIPKKQAGMVTAELEIAQRVFGRMLDMLDVRPRLAWLDEVAPHGDPSLDEIGDLADMVRARLDIPAGKVIGNTIRAFERHGIVFIPLRDLYKTPMAGRAITMIQTPDFTPLVGYWPRRSLAMRETIVHGAAHLILHRHRAPRELMEREAQTFARAFLLPRMALIDVDESSPMQSYLRLAGRYGLTVRSVVERAHDLRLIGDARKGVLLEQHDMLWPVGEPVTMNRMEQPLLARQMFGSVCGSMDSPTVSTVSRVSVENFLGIPYGLADHWCGGLLEDAREISVDLLG